MPSLDGRPGRLDATFRPDDSFTVNLTGPAGWLSSRAYTATLGGVALSVSENSDVLTIVASAAITAAATSPAQFVLTLTGGNDALVGTWSARTDGSAQTSTSAAVIIDSLDVAVTLGGDSADLNAHIADTSGAHAASAVSITDAAGDFDAEDVEGALAELQSDAETDAAALATFIDTTAPGTYEARDLVRSNVVEDGRKVLTVDGREFYIKGVNLGLNSDNFLDSWVDDWDEALFLGALDNIARAGFNTVRIVGMYRAYADGPAQYVTRCHLLFERARTLGLKVIYEFLTNSGTPSDLIDWATYESQYKAYFHAIADDYIADPMILAWGVGNELHAAGTDPNVATFLAVIQNFGPWIKTQDPTTFVTASQAISGAYEEAFARMDAVEAYVDLQAMNYYLSPSILHTSPGAIQAWVEHTDLPLFINEVGANSATTAGGPHPGGAYGQTAFMSMLRRHAVAADVNGWIWWKAFDNAASGAVMGLWDATDTPTAQLDEVMRFPDRRLTAVRDFVEARPHPVLVDNFDRTASTTVLGSPEIGPAPTIVTGTWGIKASPGGGYPATKIGSTSDKVVWDCKSRITPLFEVEFFAQTDLADFSIIWDYTDTSNFWIMRFHRHASTAADNLVTISKLVAGSLTQVVQHTLVGLAAADYPRRVRLAVRLERDGVASKTYAYPYAYGIPLPRLDTTTGGPPATTTRGLAISASDSASWVGSVRSYVHGRIGP